MATEDHTAAKLEAAADKDGRHKAIDAADGPHLGHAEHPIREYQPSAKVRQSRVVAPHCSSAEVRHSRDSIDRTKKNEALQGKAMRLRDGIIQAANLSIQEHPGVLGRLHIYHWSGASITSANTVRLLPGPVHWTQVQ